MTIEKRRSEQEDAKMAQEEKEANAAQSSGDEIKWNRLAFDDEVTGKIHHREDYLFLAGPKLQQIWKVNKPVRLLLPQWYHQRQSTDFQVIPAAPNFSIPTQRGRRNHHGGKRLIPAAPDQKLPTTSKGRGTTSKDCSGPPRPTDWERGLQPALQAKIPENIRWFSSIPR